MKYNVKRIARRPNLTITWPNHDDDVAFETYTKYCKETYDDTGKRLSVKIDGADTLDKTTTTVWKYEESALEFRNDSKILEWLVPNQKYKETNGIKRISFVSYTAHVDTVIQDFKDRVIRLNKKVKIFW